MGLANMWDKRAAALMTVESLGQGTGYLERGLYTSLPHMIYIHEGRQRGETDAQQTLLGLAGAAMAQQFFRSECLGENNLTFAAS